VEVEAKPRVRELSVAPGNGGTALIAENLDIKPTDFDALTVAAHHMDLVIVGPEEPLARGIVDHFDRERIPIMGPSQAAAELESSKVFAKALMDKYGIPTAMGCTFTNYKDARAYIEQQDPRWSSRPTAWRLARASWSPRLPRRRSERFIVLW